MSTVYLPNIGRVFSSMYFIPFDCCCLWQQMRHRTRDSSVSNVNQLEERQSSPGSQLLNLSSFCTSSGSLNWIPWWMRLNWSRQTLIMLISGSKMVGRIRYLSRIQPKSTESWQEGGMLTTFQLPRYLSLWKNPLLILRMFNHQQSRPELQNHHNLLPQSQIGPLSEYLKGNVFNTVNVHVPIDGDISIRSDTRSTGEVNMNERTYPSGTLFQKNTDRTSNIVHCEWTKLWPLVIMGTCILHSNHVTMGCGVIIGTEATLQCIEQHEQKTIWVTGARANSIY